MSSLSHHLSSLLCVKTQINLFLKFPTSPQSRGFTLYFGPDCYGAGKGNILLGFSFLELSLPAQEEVEEGGQCRIQNLKPEEPSYIIKAEAGFTEIWKINNNQGFRCVGAAMFRHSIQPGGFLLPSYASSHLLGFVEQGEGVFGLTIPGCPQTFQSSQVQLDRKRRFFDQHQKIQRCRVGEILAFPAGTAHWLYNKGDRPLVLVVIEYATNHANQLDQFPRRFFFSGNPKQGQGSKLRWSGLSIGNFFQGFPVETVAYALNKNNTVAAAARMDWKRRCAPLELVRISGKHREPTCINPKAGRYATVNSLTTPILSFLQLSASRGILYSNAIMAPHWYVNTNSMIYVTKGDAKIQIVNHRGQRLLDDDQVKRGQVVVLPMGYAVVIRAGNEGFEWVTFHTNHNAVLNTLVGHFSTFQGVPASVLGLAYQVSREQATWFKYGRDESIIFSPSSSDDDEQNFFSE